MTLLIWDDVVIKFGLTLRSHRNKPYPIFCIMMSLKSKVGRLYTTWVYRRTNIPFRRCINKTRVVNWIHVFKILLLWLLLCPLILFLFILVNSLILYPVYWLLFGPCIVWLWVLLSKTECRFLISHWLRLLLWQS